MSVPPSESASPIRTPADRPPPGPPPRPEFSPAPPPPDTSSADRRPATLRASAWLWAAGAAAGALGVVTTLVNYDTVRERVADAARSSDPSLDPGTLDTGVTATITAVLGIAVVLVVVTLACLPLVLRPTKGMRWVLAVAGLLTLLCLPLVLSLVDGGTAVDSAAFLVQAAAVVAALVTLFLRPSRTWFTADRG